MTMIEDRIRRLEDRAALDDLVVRYFLAADDDNMEGVGASFTDDAIFASSGVVNATGRQGIVDFITASRAQMGLTVHMFNCALYTFDDDDHAAGLVSAHLELVLDGQLVFGAVRYQDAYVRTGEGWRIAQRDMRTVYMAPWSEVGGALESALPVRWPGAAPLSSDYPRKSWG